MGLTSLSGSQLPNALSLGCALVLVVAAFAVRPRYRWSIVLVGAALAATVVVKNVIYNTTISEPHTENSADARHGYAYVLLVVMVAQLLAAASFLLIGLLSKRRGFGWLSGSVTLACVYAAVCTYDWRLAYLGVDASQPVHFRAPIPLLHWALLFGVAATMFLGSLLLLKGRKPVRS